MSLLEDIFLQDEASEAQELERVIEGEEFDERARSDSDNNSVKEDEAEEDKRRVDPTTKAKRIVRNPRFILNPARLCGPRGIQVIPDHFKDFKFKGKGNEKEDLDLVLKKLEHWAYRLYPKYQFSDCLKKIEILGKKRPVMVHLHKIRSDQYLSEETVVQKDSSDDEDTPAAQPVEDEFDRLLQQQIDLARSTPAPSSVKKAEENRIFNNLKVTSSPSISEEQKERMLRSRKLAEEKRLARLKTANITNVNLVSPISTPAEEHNYNTIEIDDIDTGKNKKNRSNIIDSSDEDDITINESVTIDAHYEMNTKARNRNNIDNNMEHLEGADTNEIDVSKDLSVEFVTSNLNNDDNLNKNKIDNNTDIDKNKSNIMDSSDEDDITINEIVTIDVHCDMSANIRNRNNIDNEKEHLKDIESIETESNDHVISECILTSINTNIHNKNSPMDHDIESIEVTENNDNINKKSSNN